MLRLPLSFQSIAAVGGPVCAKLHASAFGEDVAWEEEFFNKLLSLPSTRGVFAIHDGAPVGFILWVQNEEEAEILTLAVRPEMQRAKCATQLLGELEKTLYGDYVPRILLDVAADNTPAVRLYEKVRYQQIATRPGYYTRGGKKIDALVMEKNLQQQNQ